MTNINKIVIIGGGLAGCEAAYQISKFDINVDLYEMRPKVKTEAHQTKYLAELVCSNSFRSDDKEYNAVGVLHEELRIADSLIMKSADHNKVPAGSALAVDRDNFSKEVNKTINSIPNINIINQEVRSLDEFKNKRVIVSTYQAVSGAGKPAMDELFNQTKGVFVHDQAKPEQFTKKIAFNVIPHIDVFLEDGQTKEEWKMYNETKKILDQNIELTATCVRIPVMVSHAESLNIEFEKPFTLEKITQALDNAEGCKVIDERKDGGYITPVEAEGKNETFISRIRKDNSNKNTINLWCVSDNLLRGAALNAVEIAEAYIKNK